MRLIAATLSFAFLAFGLTTANAETPDGEQLLAHCGACAGVEKKHKHKPMKKANSQSMIEVIGNNKNLSTLAASLKSSKLAEKLGSQGSFTIYTFLLCLGVPKVHCLVPLQK